MKEKILLFIVVCILSNLNVAHSQNTDSIYKKIDLLGQVLETIQDAKTGIFLRYPRIGEGAVIY